MRLLLLFIYCWQIEYLIWLKTHLFKPLSLQPLRTICIKSELTYLLNSVSGGFPSDRSRVTAQTKILVPASSDTVITCVH